MSVREIRSFDYVNHEYDRVSDALVANAAAVFHAATLSATSRGESVAAEMKLDLGGIVVSAPVKIEVKGVERFAGDAGRTPLTRISVEWHAASRSRVFPIMHADIAVYPLTRTETQLDFSGNYDPPFGPLGTVLDAIAGRLVAEACVHRFVAEIAQYLREQLAPAPLQASH